MARHKRDATALDLIIRDLAEIEPGRAITGLLANQKRSFEKRFGLPP
jgi:hypothetical protein